MICCANVSASALSAHASRLVVVVMVLVVVMVVMMAPHVCKGGCKAEGSHTGQ
jgi:hypothetical protein